jgi:hypothetical protein
MGAVFIMGKKIEPVFIMDKRSKRIGLVLFMEWWLVEVIMTRIRYGKLGASWKRGWNQSASWTRGTRKALAWSYSWNFSWSSWK